MVRTMKFRRNNNILLNSVVGFVIVFHCLCGLVVSTPSLVLAFHTEPVWATRCRNHLQSRQPRWTSYSLPIQKAQRQHTSVATELVDTVLSSKDVQLLTELVEQRSRARWEGDYEQADLLRGQLQDFPLPTGYKVWMEDIPRKLGGGSHWKLVVEEELVTDDSLQEGPTILQLAHAALGLAVEASIQANLDRAKQVVAAGLANEISLVDQVIENTSKEHSTIMDHPKERLETLVLQAKDRLKQQEPKLVQYELGGRKAADAAFWFALAGVDDQDLYQGLLEVATDELERFGERSSCRRKDIYQILERFAAAGIRSHPHLLDVATRCLSIKSPPQKIDDDKDVEVQDDHLDPTMAINHHQNDDFPLLDFHSDRSLLLIWKFSTKQKKQRAFLQSAVKHWEVLKRKHNGTTTVNIDEGDLQQNLTNTSLQDQEGLDWNHMFDDPTRPLVVDVGCGMGVSLLGLATLDRAEDHSSSAQVLSSMDFSLAGDQLQWSDCNFVGVDLGGLGIGYAQGLASRWGVNGRLQFVVDSAETFIGRVQNSYPGRVHLCFIQFPTPYRLVEPAEGGMTSSQEEDEKPSLLGGNSQLPESPHDGFMVSTHLLSLVHDMLLESQGKLLLQSNCEDVAVWMRNTACNLDVGGAFEYLDATCSAAWSPDHSIASRIPQRTADWITMGGERAEGRGWFKDPILPREGATETEVACILNGTPVHRCLLVPRC